MNIYSSFFQVGTIPSDVMKGHYDLSLVVLSYLIAVLASYVALDLAGRLQREKKKNTKLFLFFGGAIAMGAGIWSMHFIGMLAFILPMSMTYEYFWTGLSLLVAMLASGFALFLITKLDRSVIYLGLGGVLLGLGIATMHYMGMNGMTDHVNIHYKFGIFSLSILIAIVASEAALWLMLKSNQGTFKQKIYLKTISSLVMGVAICGMHYTGMAAAVFTPLTHSMVMMETIDSAILARYIAIITGLIIGISLLVSTYRQKLANTVQKEKDFLDVMLNNLSDGIIAYDMDGKITVVNQAIKTILDLPKEADFSGGWSNYFEFQDPDTHELMAKEQGPFERILQGEAIAAKKLILLLKQGEERIIIVDGQLIHNEEGKKLGAVVVIHDVTHSSHMGTQLLESEKMAIVGRLTTGVAHELNQPLAIINNNMQALQLLTPEQLSKKDFDEIVLSSIRQVERAAKIINLIRGFSKENKKEYEAAPEKFVEVKQAFEDALSLVSTQFNVHEIQLVRELECAMPGPQIEAGNLEQIIVNLLSNARLAVEERKNKQEEGYAMQVIASLRHNPEAKKVILKIIDNGVGMSEKTKKQCFEPFYSTRPIGEGAGLGLAIVYNLVKHLQGSIEIQTTLNEGTTVTIVIPV